MTGGPGLTPRRTLGEWTTRGSGGVYVYEYEYVYVYVYGVDNNQNRVNRAGE